MALPVNIHDLINGETVEWERIEFKKGYNPEDILHTTCAFANDLNNWGGGYIIVGIEENNGKPVLPPYGLNINQIDPIQKELLNKYHFFEPPYFPQVVPYNYEGKNILVIWVPGGDNRPYQAPILIGKPGVKEYYVRRLSSTVKVNISEKRQLIEQTAKIPFDDRISHFGKLKDISLKLIQGFLHDIGSDLLHESNTLEFAELCRKMEIVRGPDENLRPLNIGLLMFSENPEVFFKGAVIDIVIHIDEGGSKFIEKEFKGPLHYQLRNAFDFIKSNIIKEQTIKISGQEEVIKVVNYPFDAIEESLVNSIYHRSYELENHTELNVFKNRIELISYPGALPPVDQEALMQERVIPRDYRNRRIGNYMKELKLSEGRGTGIPTIRGKMKENGNPPPELITDPDKSHFLTILKINPEWNDYESSGGTAAGIIADLTNNQQIILEFCLKNNPTSREIKSYMKSKLGTGEVDKHLKKFLDEEYLFVSKKTVLKFFKIELYILTQKGRDVLKGSF